MSVVGGPVGIAEAIFTLSFSPTTGIIKKLLSITRKKKKKKHDKILMLAKSKLISIETFFSITSTDWLGNKSWRIYYDYEGEKKYEKMKENVRNVSEKLEEKTENMRLNSVNSRT